MSSMAVHKLPSAMHSMRIGLRSRNIARHQNLARVCIFHPALRRGYAQESSSEGASTSTNTSSSGPSAGGAAGGGAVAGGVIGGLVVFLGGYAWYYFSGAKTAVNTASQTQRYMQQAADKLKESAPEPNEALSWLRQTAQSYAALIPGAKGYVDAAFNDIDAIHQKHGNEVDKIVSDTYSKLKDITKKKGVTMETAVEGWNVLEDGLKKIMELAGDAAQQILDNHPQLKEKVGGDIDQLKAMGDKLGPEAKQQVEQTWDQIKDTVSKGVGVNTIDDIRKIVKEKMDKVRSMADDAFEKGLEQAKPYLDKSPKAKELIENNKDALKQGDMSALWEKVKSAADSGSIDDLESFVKDTVDKAKQAGSGSGGSFSSSSSGSSFITSQLPSYLKMIPGAEEIASKLQRLEEIKEKHGKEAEDLLKSTIEELKQVLQKKVQDAEKLAEKAQ